MRTNCTKPVSIATKAAAMPTAINTAASEASGTFHTAGRTSPATSAAVANDQLATGKCTSAGCSGCATASARQQRRQQRDEAQHRHAGVDEDHGLGRDLPTQMQRGQVEA